jgi:hypothetical protein
MTAVGLVAGGIVLLAKGQVWGVALFAFAVVVALLGVRANRAWSRP